MRTRSLMLLFITSISLQVHAQGNPEAGQVKGHTCTGCHGIEGYNNVYPTYKVPRLGGQGASYVQSALRAYQGGERAHPTMQAHAQSLAEQDMADIAAWLAGKELAEAATDPAEAPAESTMCQACHGADGRGTDPAYPVLAGQYESYLVKALEDYRSGARRNAIMGGFAAQLTDQDIKVLARWYADQPGLRDLSGK
ncbi:MAG: c-type cytochrome [Xanthomonadales bacterium]|nr:c-type cytochrome [Xanthomonadales bacterium]